MVDEEKEFRQSETKNGKSEEDGFRSIIVPRTA